MAPVIIILTVLLACAGILTIYHFYIKINMQFKKVNPDL